MATTTLAANQWNGAEGHLWATETARYDRMLEPYGRALAGALALAPGESVLDVGCGAGASTLAAAAAVGPGGRVRGVDLSAPLLEVAQARVAEMPQVELVHADASTTPYPPATFDAITSRFGMMLFPAPEAAFAHLAGALKPGGRLVFTTWAERAANAWMTIPLAAVAAHIELPPPADDAPCAFALAAPSRIHELCAKAGLVDVRIVRREERVHVGRDVTDTVAFYERTAGDLRAMLGDELADRIVATLRMALVPYAEGDCVRLASAAWIVSARRAR
jgi:SAM-dependent methyltransferase